MCTRLSIYDDCTFAKVNERFLAHCKPFSCGDSDLDDFFLNDALAYEKDLMGKTYCWVINDDITKVVGFVTLANAGIQTTHMQNNPKRHLHKNISYNKQGRTYPAVLIGRIAVAKEFQGKEYRIGTQMMDFVKDWFIAEDNKTGCRFVLVDAVNSNRTLQYYERNGFKPLFPRIEDEKDFYQINGDDLKTRMYYFDLLLLK
ncbi:MAG: GNAT family N-acetyltransferase [Muribaculaceae bacterium]|nr:GNAT family N-acetyltransferase [Muribaculaceae bacterium]